MNPKTLNHWYKNCISDNKEDTKNGNFAGNIAYVGDDQTGEVLHQQVIHIMKPKNVGTHMCIDEKMIGKKYCTILSNAKTGKIAMLIESMNPLIIKDALSIFDAEILNQVQQICCDMSPMMKKICRECFSKASIIIDKFHVLKHVYDFIHGIRIGMKNNLDKKDNVQVRDTLWTAKQLLTKSRYVLMRPKVKWSADEKIMAKHLFGLYPKIKLAYEYVQRLRSWYNIENKVQPQWWLEKNLEQWVEDIEQDFPVASKFICKMIIKHEEHIINFFKDGLTNSKAENLNGKIQRFVANNYGLRNRDFFYYRLQVYFA